jgi:Type-F conjugative transfer system pilin assembly protein
MKKRLVMRGMVQNSMMKTAAFTKEIGCRVDIDPKAFETHKITQVPVFLKGDKVIKGNVTLDYAMEKLQ